MAVKKFNKVNYFQNKLIERQCRKVEIPNLRVSSSNLSFDSRFAFRDVKFDKIIVKSLKFAIGGITDASRF